MKHDPVISEYMIPATKSVVVGTPLHQAIRKMKRSHITYLPVQRGKKIVGVLNARNLKRAAHSRWGSEFRVEDVMVPHPCVVRPDASLYEVLDEMPDHRGGYTVIQNKKGKVTGIFTSLEAVKAFHDLSCGMAYKMHWE